ncbi:MAG: hypothetical protein K5796_05835 [Lachnospiraceae bacterium]|nr:hypothetical protein [Lachnospiraceae bacterium]
MAKKRKKLTALLVIGAAVAGAYYFLNKKNSEIPADMSEDEDDEEFEDDTEEEPKAPKAGKRSYVSLDFNTVEQKVQDVAAKFADTASKAATSLGNLYKQAEGKVEEFFDDRREAKNAAGEHASEETEAPENNGESEEKNEQ